MTILLAYAPRPEGQAALDKALQLAKQNNPTTPARNNEWQHWKPETRTHHSNLTQPIINKKPGMM